MTREKSDGERLLELVEMIEANILVDPEDSIYTAEQLAALRPLLEELCAAINAALDKNPGSASAVHEAMMPIVNKIEAAEYDMLPAECKVEWLSRMNPDAGNIVQVEGFNEWLRKRLKAL
jgi:hypothetical protein